MLPVQQRKRQADKRVSQSTVAYRVGEDPVLGRVLCGQLAYTVDAEDGRLVARAASWGSEDHRCQSSHHDRPLFRIDDAI